MAILLKNSLFIHIPKCGGRWVKDMLINYVKESQYVGDPVYGSHNSPDIDMPVFCAVREPAAFASSLWNHRARKKNITRGDRFNWQNYIRLEAECASSDYQQFMQNVSCCKNGVTDYYHYYVARYKKVFCVRQENLANARYGTCGSTTSTKKS